jgi:hypothetical protein
MRQVSLQIAVLALIGLGGCTGLSDIDSVPPVCIAGQVTVCACQDGSDGTRVCNEAGTDFQGSCLCVESDVGELDAHASDTAEDASTDKVDTIAVEDILEDASVDSLEEHDDVADESDTPHTADVQSDTAGEVDAAGKVDAAGEVDAADEMDAIADTDGPDVAPCVPACDGKECGKDGCGGSCGECEDGAICSGGACSCLPDCTDKECGNDGCGGSCGVCDDGNACTLDGCSEKGLCFAEEMALVDCEEPPCAVNNQCMYWLDRSKLSGVERMVALSLQGVTSQHRPAMWVGGAGSSIYPDELESAFGVTFVGNDDLWDLVSRFNTSLSGYLLFDANTSSQSVAMSLSGLWGALAITPEMEPTAQALGLSLAMDVRGKDEAWCWANYGNEFNPTMMAEQKQTEQFGAFLLDYPIAQKAFIYFDEACGDFRTQIALQLDNPLIFGWGQECGEFEFAKGASEGGAAVIPADWSSNLSVLSNVENAIVVGNQHAADDGVTTDGTHYVAFVMSDGDNIQFMQNAFNDPPWWGNMYRGDFPMGWEMSPVLEHVAPSILQWIYATATPNDQAVGGPSGAGYAFPSVHADPTALALETAKGLQATDMRLTTILNTGGGLEAGDVFVKQPEIDGVIYKDFSDYNGKKGELRWTNGKPIVAFRYLLWNNGSVEDSPEGVAAAINMAPKDPKSDIASYSFVNIHAWSEWPDNPYGDWAMDAAKWTVELLDDHVKVVSPEELLWHLTTNLQGVTVPLQPPTLVFEAETDLSHQIGYADGDGWACNTADQEAGHMCYGPYATEISAGSHTATFRLMIDVTGPPASNDKVVTLDVFDANTGAYLAVKALNRYDFNAPFTTQDFPLEFVNEAGSNLEFRVFWHATSYVNVDKVTIE